MYFAIIFGVLLLFPIGLLLWGQSKLRGHTPDIDEDYDRTTLLQLSRRTAWFCCLMPIAMMLFSFLPNRAMGNFGIYLWFILPMAGVLAGLTAVVLFVISARTSERILGPVACVSAIAMSILLVFGGMAAS